MTQVLQLLTVIAVGVGLTFYAFIVDRKEHCDSRQQSIPFPAAPAESEHHELVSR